MIKFVVAGAFLALNFYTYYYLATNEVIPPRTTFDEFPREIGDWRCQEQEPMSERVIRELGVTDWVVCTFLRDSRPRGRVGVYIGYHETQVRKQGGGAFENAIHPPKHCLPGSGWNIMQSQVVNLEIPGFPEGGARVNRFMIARGNDRQLVYYWYHSRGRVIAEDWRKIIELFWDRATRQRTDGSLVRFTIPVVRGQEEPAEEAFRDLASQIVPMLSAYVPE